MSSKNAHVFEIQSALGAQASRIRGHKRHRNLQWQLNLTSSFSMTSKMPSQARSIQSPVAVKAACNTSKATSRHLKTMSPIQFCSDSSCLLCFLSTTYSIPAAELSPPAEQPSMVWTSGTTETCKAGSKMASFQVENLSPTQKKRQVASSCCCHQLSFQRLSKSHHILAKVNKPFQSRNLAPKKCC